MNSSQKHQLAEPLVEFDPEHLRPPEKERGEDGKQAAAAEHVVKVRDDEVRVVRLIVDRRRRDHHAGHAAEQKVQQEIRSQNSIGVGNEIEPRHIVAIQLKNFTPVGTAMRNETKAEERVVDGTGREHVMRPNAHREPRNRERREYEPGVAEDRLPREDGTISLITPKYGRIIT